MEYGARLTSAVLDARERESCARKVPVAPWLRGSGFVDVCSSKQLYPRLQLWAVRKDLALGFLAVLGTRSTEFSQASRAFVIVLEGNPLKAV